VLAGRAHCQTNSRMVGLASWANADRLQLHHGRVLCIARSMLLRVAFGYAVDQLL
jgi:hypothetical protein